MTSNESTQPVAATAAPFGDDDPRAVFAKAVALGGAVIGGVRPDQLDDPTPCTEFDVRQLIGHLVAVLRGVAAIGRGEDPFSVRDIDGVADDAWQQAWSRAADEVQAAWSDDAVLARVVRLPWSQRSGAETLAVYVNEVTVHTWDLATATGQHPAWDPQVLQVAYDAIRQSLPGDGRTALFEAVRAQLPEELREGAAPFAEVVAVPDDAPLIDRLVAWNGRRP